AGQGSTDHPGGRRGLRLPLRPDGGGPRANRLLLRVESLNQGSLRTAREGRELLLQALPPENLRARPPPERQLLHRRGAADPLPVPRLPDPADGSRLLPPKSRHLHALELRHDPKDGDGDVPALPGAQGDPARGAPPPRDDSMKRLLVVADDLGLTLGIYRGLATAFREGILTSASLLSNTPHFAATLALA